jgi:hypothetical protein
MRACDLFLGRPPDEFPGDRSSSQTGRTVGAHVPVNAPRGRSKIISPEVYRFRDVAEVRAALVAAGFSIEAELAPGDANQIQPPHLILARSGG